MIQNSIFSDHCLFLLLTFYYICESNCCIFTKFHPWLLTTILNLVKFKRKVELSAIDQISCGEFETVNVVLLSSLVFLWLNLSQIFNDLHWDEAKRAYHCCIISFLVNFECSEYKEGKDIKGLWLGLSSMVTYCWLIIYLPYYRVVSVLILKEYFLVVCVC